MRLYHPPKEVVKCPGCGAVMVDFRVGQELPKGAAYVAVTYSCKSSARYQEQVHRPPKRLEKTTCRI